MTAFVEETGTLTCYLALTTTASVRPLTVPLTATLRVITLSFVRRVSIRRILEAGRSRPVRRRTTSPTREVVISLLARTFVVPVRASVYAYNREFQTACPSV